jgi:Ca2+/Na+ antiporter
MGSLLLIFLVFSVVFLVRFLLLIFFVFCVVVFGKNTTKKTKKMSNTDPTKNTTEKATKKSNMGPTKNHNTEN